MKIKTMAFIRIKRRTYKEKTYSFAYLVENKWNKKTKSATQKIKKYLGRVCIIDCDKVVKDVVFDKDFKENILKLIEHQLLICGFKTIREGVLGKEKVFFESKKKKISSSNKKIVLKMNEGFLCNETIKQLIKFKVGSDFDVRIEGEKLATLIVNAGLKISNELFIQLFESIV